MLISSQWIKNSNFCQNTYMCEPALSLWNYKHYSAYGLWFFLDTGHRFILILLHVIAFLKLSSGRKKKCESHAGRCSLAGSSNSIHLWPHHNWWPLTFPSSPLLSHPSWYFHSFLHPSTLSLQSWPIYQGLVQTGLLQGCSKSLCSEMDSDFSSL